MKTLKDLTQEECIKIASLAEPTINWKLVQSKNKWNGFDLISADCQEETKSEFIFQIDYRSSDEIQSKSRFRIYRNLHEYLPNIEAIHNYLISIGCQFH